MIFNNISFLKKAQQNTKNNKSINIKKEKNTIFITLLNEKILTLSNKDEKTSTKNIKPFNKKNNKKKEIDKTQFFPIFFELPLHSELKKANNNKTKIIDFKLLKKNSNNSDEKLLSSIDKVINTKKNNSTISDIKINIFEFTPKNKKGKLENVKERKKESKISLQKKINSKINNKTKRKFEFKNKIEELNIKNNKSTLNINNLNTIKKNKFEYINKNLKIKQSHTIIENLEAKNQNNKNIKLNINNLNSIKKNKTKQLHTNINIKNIETNNNKNIKLDPNIKIDKNLKTELSHINNIENFNKKNSKIENENPNNKKTIQIKNNNEILTLNKSNIHKINKKKKTTYIYKKKNEKFQNNIYISSNNIENKSAKNIYKNKSSNENSNLNIFDRIVRKILMYKDKNNTKRLKIKFKEDFIKDLEIEVSLKNNEVKIKFKSNNEDINEWIKSNFVEFKDLLEEHNIKLTKYEIAHDDNNQKNYKDNGEQHKHKNKREHKQNKNNERGEEKDE